MSLGKVKTNGWSRWTNYPGFKIRAFGAWAGVMAQGYCSGKELMGNVGVASIDSLIVASALYAAFQWGHGTKVN